MDILRKLNLRKSASQQHGDGLPNYSSEEALQVLKDYDIVFLVDDSGSMYGPRWNEARAALAGVARIAAKHDNNGVDVHFLNSNDVATGITTNDEVRKLFDVVTPYGPTPIGNRLESLLDRYITNLETALDHHYMAPKPVNFIVITDGVPTDDLQSVIVANAQRLDKRNILLSQLGIQFFQVGNDAAATKALEELDNNLVEKFKIRDIVDTTPYKRKPLSDEAIIKVLLGAINRRVDNKGGAAVMQK